MTEVFVMKNTPWTYEARIPAALRSTQLPLPAPAPGTSLLPYHVKHDAEYWAQQSKEFDFSAQDRLDSARFNLVLWKGIMGEDKPYPSDRDGRDLRENRQELLRRSATNERE
jgi:hypothetical protein